MIGEGRLRNRFVPVSRANEVFQLGHRDPLCRYPTGKTWQKFVGAHEVLETLDKLLTDVVSAVLVGPPGSGKTFHALLSGFNWETRVRSLSWRPAAFDAYYASASMLDATIVESEQWSLDEVRHNSCLWIVDDLNTNPQTGSDLLELLRDEALDEAGHRILFIGWAAPEEMKALPTYSMSLSSHNIRAAIEACNLRAPTDRAIRDLANEKMMSLRTILAFAKHSPEVLEESPPHRVLREAVFDRLKPLTETQKRLTEDIARLHYLGIPFIGDKTDWDDLEHLGQVGLLQKSQGSASGWRMTEDEDARLILFVLFHGSGIQEFFIRPLRDLCGTHPEMLLPVVRSLKHLATRELSQWMGVEKEESSSRGLLEEFLMDGEFVISMVRNNLDLSVAARILRSASKKVDRHELSRSLLEVHEKRLRKGLAEGDLGTWRTSQALTAYSRDERLQPMLVAALAHPALRQALREMNRARRGAVLEEIRSCDPAQYVAVKRSLLPANAHVLTEQLLKRTSAGIWKGLTGVADLDQDLAVQALETLKIGRVTEAIIREPGRCARFVAPFKQAEKGDYERIMTVFERALEHVSISSEVVTGWTSPYDLIRFTELAVRLRRGDLLEKEVIVEIAMRIAARGSVGAVVDLSRVARRSTILKSTVADGVTARLQSVQEPNAGLLHALMLVDRQAAKQCSDALLQGLIERGDLTRTETTFWFMWNVVTSLPMREQEVLKQFARKVTSVWKPSRPLTSSELALIGLLAFIDEMRMSTLDFDSEMVTGWDLEKATSPVLSTCVLYGLAFSTQTEPSKQRWLEWQIRVLITLPKGYRATWLRLHPRARRILLMMIARVFHHLYRSPRYSPLAREIASASTLSDGDDVWDDELGTRLSIALIGAGLQAASALILRRGKVWQRALEGGSLQGEGLVRFLWIAVAIAKGDPACADTVLDLVRTAIQSGGEERSVVLILEGLERHMVGKMFVGEKSTEAVLLDSVFPLLRVLGCLSGGRKPQSKDVNVLRIYSSDFERQLLREILTSAGIAKDLAG